MATAFASLHGKAQTRAILSQAVRRRNGVFYLWFAFVEREDGGEINNFIGSNKRTQINRVTYKGGRNYGFYTGLVELGNVLVVVVVDVNLGIIT